MRVGAPEAAEKPTDAPRHETLARLPADLMECVPEPSITQVRLLEDIRLLRLRLLSERFQLAVLGQFKRGKSTLLNALLGAAALPTAVIPLTAIPTVLQAGPRPSVRVHYTDNRQEETSALDVAALRDLLGRLVTEDANPKNKLGLARVEVSLSSPLLDQGVVLIDTPGVGSTYLHNTAAAEAVLPECDAALFVVSPDPPITEVELRYLAQILPTVAHLVVVLNKIDAVESEDRLPATEFLAGVLAGQAGMERAAPIFCLSARDGLRAKQAGDAEALTRSGLPELEAYLTKFLREEKRITLAVAVARKATALASGLRLETGIVLQALRLPLDELAQRITIFDRAAKQFEMERRTVRDLLRNSLQTQSGCGPRQDERSGPNLTSS